MKEFNAQDGGRHTYADDLINLQDLALSITSIFDECDNFIVSGCNIQGQGITSGIVFINGKLRKFAGHSNVNQFPVYLCEHNSYENVSYESGGDKVGRTVFGCKLSDQLPSSIDPITNKVGQYIVLERSGGLRFKDAFIAKYALALNPTASSQLVNKPVVFNGNVSIGSNLDIVGQSAFKRGDKSATIAYLNKGWQVSVPNSPTDNTTFTILNDGSVELSVNGVKVFSVSGDGSLVANSVSTSLLTSGKIQSVENKVFNHSDSNDGGSLEINTVGYNGEVSKFRDTHIGDGKGGKVLSIIGQESKVVVNGAWVITPKRGELESVLSFNANSGTHLLKIVAGDNSTVITPSSGFVDIKSAIKEDGVLLSDKYVTSQSFRNTLGTLALKENTYSKGSADQTFVSKQGGILQLVSDTYPVSRLLSDLGLQSAKDDEAKFMLRETNLTDFLDSQDKIDRFVGHLGLSKLPPTPPIIETAWYQVREQPNLWVKRTGSAVFIQGKINTIHEGVVFRIPSDIPPPARDAIFSVSYGMMESWVCSIASGKRDAVVNYCSMHGKTIPFTLTYAI